jgi:iron complex outermembrane recepter protein
MLISRASMGIEGPTHWAAQIFLDNLTNNEKTPIRGVYDLADLNTRIRPRTIGVQFQYHLR